MQRIQLHGSGASGFSNSSKTRAKPTTYETKSSLGLVPPGVVCHLDASMESTAPVKEPRVLTTQRDFEGPILTKSRFQ